MWKNNNQQRRAIKRTRLENRRKKKNSLLKHDHNLKVGLRREYYDKLKYFLKRWQVLWANYFLKKIYNKFWSEDINYKLGFSILRRKFNNTLNNQNYVLWRSEKMKIIYSLKSYKSKYLSRPFYYAFLWLIRINLMKISFKYDIVKNKPKINVYWKFSNISGKYYSNDFYEIIDV